jgi:hypothetical protein
MDLESRDLAVHALAGLDRLRPPGTGADVWEAAVDVAGRAADLLVGGSGRRPLLEHARSETDAHQAAACALAAALAGAEATWVLDAAATFAAIAGGVVGSVPGVALDAAGAGTVVALLERSAPDEDAGREHRLAELFVAGTLVRATAHEVSLQEGLDAVALVEPACAAIDGLDVDALLAHVYGVATLPAAGDEDALAERAALAGGALALNVLPRVTGGLLNRDLALQRKGWSRAGALLAELARAAGLDLHARDVRAAAARLASDRALLGTPEGTITDLLATALGLQAAVPLGGAGDPGPAAHLLARLVAWTALASRD